MSARWSMSASLTVYYLCSVFILLTTTSLFLYLGLDRSVQQDNEDRLIHKIQVMTLLVQKQPFDREGIEQEVQEEAEISADSQSPFFLRLLDRQGDMLTETPGMATTLPVAAFPKSDSTQTQEKRWQPTPGTAFLLASALVAGAPGGPAQWRIQSALNVSASERLLARYRRDIALVLLAGLFVAAPVSLWITRRGLRPITDITRATESIGAQQLQQRIGAGGWPRELLAMTAAFDRMLDRLQEAFERLSQFSADLAHELRTPINNLMGEGQVVLSRPRSTTEYVKALQSALEEHERLARMIDSMLFLAQADQARAVLSPVVLDARAEMQAVVDFYQALADEQGVQLVCEGRGTVAADPQLLRRAISNLLSNALKYSTRGGLVTLRVNALPGEMRLSVIDCGLGIAAAHLTKLGDRFYRVDPSRTDSQAGAGLGLAIVKSIMSLHGGRLLIDSRVGAGTNVSLVFAAVD